MTDLRFPASRRIKRPSEFRRVYDQGRKRVGRFLVLWVLDESPEDVANETAETPVALTRVGIVASKKVGNAVARARAKRRLRSAFRLNQHDIKPRKTVVLVSRRPVLDAPWERVEADFLTLCREADLLIDPPSAP